MHIPNLDGLSDEEIAAKATYDAFHGMLIALVKQARKKGISESDVRRFVERALNDAREKA